MIGLDSITETGSGEAASVLWTGRSGRRYLMEREREAGVAMAPSRLYALENNGVIGWAGTAEDLIGDHRAREKFRRLSAGGASMLSLVAPRDPLAVMTLVWDLEGSRRALGRAA
ncbi:MAG TPA: hypothetical protein DIT93_05515 [Pelagibacterium sp.]|uniref:hypothetical protein n=1 Tax=uncultured Pelagibacterium sp. TaxID=1159875 RepID=UPI000C51000E|nr:hypothetical protein [Pelagibacterium sp.]HCO54459.1 hypothetical protein [Pelagibacterium sp.]|tara:strand:+ start:461 stop:802 length:342 start_codon:yes stop_codon:yes gene_type:complete